MDTRLRTRMRAGGIRLHYQQFDYSTINPERERSENLLSDEPNPSEAEPPALVDALLPHDDQPMSPEPAINDKLPLFSEPEIIPDAAQTQDASTATAEAEVSLAGTSAPLLTNPSWTDVPVSVPPMPDGISNLQDTETSNTELFGSDEPAARHNVPSTRDRGRPGAAQLLYLVVQNEEQVPNIRICARARKDKVPEDVLKMALLGGPEDTLPPLHGRLLLRLTHSHQLHRILILKRPLRSLLPMLTKALHRLTHTMTYAVIDYLGNAVEPAGSAIALAFCL